MSNNTWFTSDHHFNHANIIKYCNRPFSSKEEMDEALIDAWNRNIKPDDTVYHLGDFALSNNRKIIDDYFYKLNGNVFIVQGNHDVWMSKNKGFFPITILHMVTRIPAEYELKINGEIIVLSHYSMRSWNKSHHGSWHLFGHTHGAMEGVGLSFDVGVDTNNFNPYSFDEIKERMKKIKESLSQ